MIRQSAEEFLREKMGEKVLKITTTQIFWEIMAVFNLPENAERPLKELLMQLDQHMVIDDFEESEWERRIDGKESDRESQTLRRASTDRLGTGRDDAESTLPFSILRRPKGRVLVHGTEDTTEPHEDFCTRGRRENVCEECVHRS